MGTALALLPGGVFRGWNMKWRVSGFHQTPLSSTDSIEDAEIVEPAKMTNDTTSEFAAKVKAAFEAFEDVKSSEAAVAALKGAQGVLGQLGNNASRASTAGAGIFAAVAGGAAFGAAGGVVLGVSALAAAAQDNEFGDLTRSVGTFTRLAYHSLSRSYLTLPPGSPESLCSDVHFLPRAAHPHPLPTPLLSSRPQYGRSHCGGDDQGAGSGCLRVQEWT